MSLNVAQLGRAIEASDRPALPAGGFRRAAVFVLLAQRRQTSLLLIRRADRGDPWSNHIAFPGGHVDPSDADPLQTAYRETLEELGIGPQDIDYLGELGHFQTKTSPIDLHAFVGLWKGRRQLRADPSEVAQVYEVPLDELLCQHQGSGFAARSIEQLGDDLVYQWDSQTVWGVTARIIHHLMNLIVVQFTPAADPPRLARLDD